MRIHTHMTQHLKQFSRAVSFRARSSRLYEFAPCSTQRNHLMSAAQHPYPPTPVSYLYLASPLAKILSIPDITFLFFEHFFKEHNGWMIWNVRIPWLYHSENLLFSDLYKRIIWSLYPVASKENNHTRYVRTLENLEYHNLKSASLRNPNLT